MTAWLSRARRGVQRSVYRFVRRSRVFRPFRVDRRMDVLASNNGVIRNVQVIEPFEPKVWFGGNSHDADFLRICKYYPHGWYERAAAVVCEVPGGYVHVDTGLVCTRRFVAVNDSQMSYRIPFCEPYRGFKPIRARRYPGAVATIQNMYWDHWWHWIVDCLPRLCLLEKAYPGQPVTLLAPTTLRPAFMDSLRAVLPPDFRIEQLPPGAWVRPDTVLLPSYLSSRCNGHMPAEYYERIRRRAFASLGLDDRPQARARLYVSRSRTQRRRVLNEDALVRCLERYGFISVTPETMPFGDQVRLFRDAEVIVAPHGSNWGNLVFSGAIKILVLHADRSPNTHEFTMARAMGQEHFFLTGTEQEEDADFVVDIERVARTLERDMHLQPVGRPAA